MSIKKQKNALVAISLRLGMAGLILALAFLAQPVLPAHAGSNTWTVTKTADTNDGVCDSDCSLREAIAAAGSGDTVLFDSSLSGQTITLASTLTLFQNVTIDGSSLASQIIVSGNGAVQIFVVNSGVTASLKNLTITKGHSSSSSLGGGIYNQGTLTVTNSTFTSNYSRYGGGIASEGTLTVTNSTFSGNSALGYGGGIENYSTATVTNSTFSGNSSVFGGGIGTYGTLTVTNSTFSGNLGNQGQGGGIGNDGTTAVTNSTFSSNSAAEGGGIFNAYFLTVTNSTFSSNSASIGGGIVNWGRATVTSSTFSGNSAAYDGGGIYSVSSNGPLTVTDSTFSGNSAPQGGGGIENNDGTATLKNTIVANSTSGGNCASASSSAIGGSNNLADDGSCGSNFTNSASILLGTLGSYGGSTQTIPLLPGSSAIDAGNATYCTTGSDQRGVSYVGTCDIGAFESQGFTLTKTGGDNQSTLINTAFTTPLGLKVMPNDASEPVDGGVVTLTAPSSEASLATTTYNLTIASGAVSQSVTANGTTGSYNVAASASGATSVNFALSNIDSPTVTTNAASLVTSSGATLNGTVNANNASSIVTFEYGLDTGYGTTVTATQSPVTGVTDTAVSKAITGLSPNTLYHFRVVAVNSADTTNGGDQTFTSSCLSAITVASTADSGAGSLRQAINDVCAGGTITFDTTLSGQTITLASTLTLSKNVTIDGSSLASQVAVSGNGAVRIFVVNSGVTASLKNLTITKGYGSSSASFGGGIYNDGTLTVTNSTFSGNSADFGGGIYSDGTLTVTNSTFSGNSALDYGGGIENYSTATVTNSTFSGNYADYGGGIISDGPLMVTNSTFSDNSAVFGGGIYNEGTLTVTNSTISGNSADYGGGIRTYFGTATLKNTIVANSTSGGNCDGTIGGSNNLADDSSCGSNFTYSASILLSTLGSYGGSTQTIPLLPGSAAINAGNAASCTTGSDQRGVSYVGTCDIGAFESQGFTLTKTGGDNQSATVSTAFTKPLALTVGSSHSEPVDGGVVTLTAPSSGASLATTTYHLTIVYSAVSQNVTANSITGSYKVTASASGATDVSFSLTNGQAPGINSVGNNGPINEGTSATITVSASNPTGISDVLQYEFDCDNNGSYEIGPQSINTASCAFDDNGSFTVNVRVSNTYGSTTGSTIVTVNNVAPTAAFNAPASANEGANFNLSLTSPSDPSSADTAAGFTYAFDCGDGSGYGTFSAVNNTTCTAAHNSSQSVKGKIQDKDGGFTEYTASVSVDITAPTVTAFTVPSKSSSLTIPITTFTATDDVAVTGYMITTSSTAPLAGDAGWSASAPASYHVASNGNYTLYPWAKDASGNVSALYASPASVSVGNLLTNGGFNTYVSPATIPQYWYAQNFTAPDGKNTSNVEEGPASIQIGSHKPALTKTLSQPLMLKGLKGDVFTFSFWVKGLNIPTAGICSGSVLFYREPVLTGPGTPLILVGTKTIPCPTGTFGFLQKSLTFTAPGNFTKIVATFTYSKISGTVWFDNAGLFK